MSAPDSEVPDKITLKLDQVTRQMIEAARRTSGLNLSATVRMLIALGAEREGKLDQAFKSSAWRETAMKASASFQKKVAEMMPKIFQELPEE